MSKKTLRVYCFQRFAATSEATKYLQNLWRTVMDSSPQTAIHIEITQKANVTGTSRLLLEEN